jgi:RNA polymerase sigma factor for flagellar operon FliA
MAEQSMKNNYEEEIKREQDQLAIDYLPAVKAIAFKLKERLPSSIEINDLISIGIEELVKLSRRYDKTLNDSFWGYAKKRVYGSMLDFLRSLDTISRGNRRLVKAIEEEVYKYYNKYEEEPTDAYLAEVLEESVQKIKDARLAAEIYTTMPLDEQLAVFEGSNAITEKLEKEELVEFISDVLHTLNEREQMVIQLYYFEELNLKEISEVLNITQSRISQIHKSVIIKIRKKLGNIDG